MNDPQRRQHSRVVARIGDVVAVAMTIAILAILAALVVAVWRWAL